ncbi:iron-containing alcohol dehydrogenase [candidate division KSB1 bacterium]
MNFHMPTKILFGSGNVNRLKEIVSGEMNVSKTMIVTDKGITKSGILDKILSQVENAAVFDEIEANPKSGTVNKAGMLAREIKPELVIAVGGGSPLDAGKAVALLAANDGNIEDYEGKRIYKDPPLPVLAVPTTCGTGSEVTWVSVITDTKRNFKMSIKGPEMFPEIALVDPDLLISLPQHLIASTGLDALTHAVEAYTVKPATRFTSPLALKACELIFSYIERAYNNIKEDIEARKNIMLASTIAGIAFGNSDVGAVHCISESVGALFDLPHGVTNSVFLPYVMKFNMSECSDKYEDIASVAGINEKNAETAARKLIEKIMLLSRDLKIPTFKELGIGKEHFQKIAEFSFQNNSNPSNPREAAVKDYLIILKDAVNQ